MTPLSKGFGVDGDMSIDRYYIENFLARHADDICGDMLEIDDDTCRVRASDEFLEEQP